MAARIGSRWRRRGLPARVEFASFPCAPPSTVVRSRPVLYLCLGLSCRSPRPGVAQNLVTTILIVTPRVWAAEPEIKKMVFFVLHPPGKRGIINPFNGVKWGGYITLIRARFSRMVLCCSDARVVRALWFCRTELCIAAYEPRRGSVVHRSPPQPVPPPRHFYALASGCHAPGDSPLNRTRR
jgi:hypothetical protein